MGRNSSSSAPSTRAVRLVQTARALERDRREVLAVDQDALRGARQARVAADRRHAGAARPADRGKGSAKSNSRTAPGPMSRSWDTLTETIGTQSDRAIGESRWTRRVSIRSLKTSAVVLAATARLQLLPGRGRPSGATWLICRAASAARDRRRRRPRAECRRPARSARSSMSAARASAARTRLVLGHALRGLRVGFAAACDRPPRARRRGPGRAHGSAAARP